MEEPPFIKCEPNWLPEPDTENFCNFDSEVQLPSQNPMVVKVETNPCVEEESKSYVTEDLQNMESETLDEENRLLANNDKNSSMCTRLEIPSDNVDSSPYEENNRLVHKCTEECKSLKIPRSSKNQPVHCRTCNKLISHPRNLNRHMKTHKEEQSYSCDKCGKMFTLLAYLNMHMFVHSHDRPHTCDTCGRNFRRKHNLKNHQSIHLEEKPVSK